MIEANREKLKDIVRGVLELPEGAEVESVKRITTRRWDSLAQVSLIAAIEGEFSLALPVGDYGRFTSYKAIELLLDEKGL
jgi:acyl carrier protein